MPVVCGYRKETAGKDIVYLSWEPSHGLWLWNSVPASQGREGAGRAPAAAPGFFLLLLELVSLGSSALTRFQYLLGYFCFIFCPRFSAL